MGLVVAATLVAAMAVSGAMGGKPSADASAAAGQTAAGGEFVTKAFMSIDWGSGNQRSDHIEILSWSWGLSQSGSPSGGSGGGAGVAQFQDLAISKRIDKSSPLLMQACASGTHIKEVIISFVTVDKKGNETQYMVITMKDLLVSSYQAGGASGSDTLPVESVSLNYAEIHVDYKEQDKETGETTTVHFGWDLKENKKV